MSEIFDVSQAKLLVKQYHESIENKRNRISEEVFVKVLAVIKEQAEKGESTVDLNHSEIHFGSELEKIFYYSMDTGYSPAYHLLREEGKIVKQKLEELGFEVNTNIAGSWSFKISWVN